MLTFLIKNRELSKLKNEVFESEVFKRLIGGKILFDINVPKIRKNQSNKAHSEE